PLSNGCSARFDALNRLKSVIEIDLKSAAGRAEIRARVSEADVFLHNWAPGKAAAFGLDHDDLLALKPTLVYGRAAGWDRDVSHGLPGTDFMAQAHTGVADAIAPAPGGRGGTLFTALDVLGGAVAAQGITAALFARLVGRSGARVRTSLAGAASLLCAGAVDQAGCGVFPTADGLAVLTRRLRTKGTDDWLPLLAAAGVPASRVVEDLALLPQDPRARSLLTGATCSQVNSPWRFVS
ncbi:MAG: CoA transferase, partial [Microvirgula sp.]